MHYSSHCHFLCRSFHVTLHIIPLKLLLTLFLFTLLLFTHCCFLNVEVLLVLLLFLRCYSYALPSDRSSHVAAFTLFFLHCTSRIAPFMLLFPHCVYCATPPTLLLLCCSSCIVPLALLFSHYNSHVVPFALQFLHSFFRAIALALLLMHYPSWAKVHNVTLLPQLFLSHFSQVCVYLVFVALFMLPLLLYFAWLMWYFPPALAICRLEFGALTPTWAPKVSYITYFHFLIYFFNCSLVFVVFILFFLFCYCFHFIFHFMFCLIV